MRLATRAIGWAAAMMAMASLGSEPAAAQERAPDAIRSGVSSALAVNAERLSAIDVAIPFRVLDPAITKRLQRELRRRGYYGAPVDGVAGWRTRAALRAFQQDRGLEPTAQLDLATAHALELGVVVELRHGSGAEAGPDDADDREPDAEVRAVQQALRRRGFHDQEADGLMGPATRSSIRRFQRHEGLEASGKLDEPTRRALGLEREAGSVHEGPDGAHEKGEPSRAPSPADGEGPIEREAPEGEGQDADGPEDDLDYDRWDPGDVKIRMPA